MERCSKSASVVVGMDGCRQKVAAGGASMSAERGWWCGDGPCTVGAQVASGLFPPPPPPPLTRLPLSPSRLNETRTRTRTKSMRPPPPRMLARPRPALHRLALEQSPCCGHARPPTVAARPSHEATVHPPPPWLVSSVGLDALQTALTGFAYLHTR